jgi:hypothetical protein
VEYWSIGAVEYWSIEAVEYWSIGVLEYWSIGVPLISATYVISGNAEFSNCRAPAQTEDEDEAEF